MSGPGDGWPPSWDDHGGGGDHGAGPGDAPWDWATGDDGPADPTALPDEPAGTDLPDAVDPGAEPVDAAAAGEPQGLPVEPPADWTDPDPAGWSDQPDAYASGGDDPFPPALEVGMAPADGGPWADPDLLGADTPLPPPGPPADPPAALRADLAAADGDPGADWAALRGSDDPAVRALAAFWRPTD